jgi:hypothetical protein
MLSVGLGEPPSSISGIKESIVRHFTVSPAGDPGMSDSD